MQSGEKRKKGSEGKQIREKEKGERMKKNRKSLALIICLALVLSLLVFPVSAASSVDKGAGTPSKEYPMVFIHGYLGWG